MCGRLRPIWKYLAPDLSVLRRRVLEAVSLTVLILGAFPLEEMSHPEMAVVFVPICAVMLSAFVIACTLSFRWTWRLALHVCRFHTASSARIALHYAPELEDSLCFPQVFDRYHRELVYLTQRFGIELAAPVDVFLLAAPRDIHRVWRTDFGGYALTWSNAIVLAAGIDNQEMIRHEFTHLFSAQWNPSAPPFLSEGLSVWMQGTERGRSIESAATTAIRDKSLTLNRLLTSPGLFRERGFRRHSCYLLAGSFTGFLIRHCGWERYRRFYCQVGATDFRTAFKQCLGLSFEIAECRWRREACAL